LAARAVSYPKVHDEFETMRMLHSGYSIARFGDGEFKLMDGKDQCREPANPKLAGELRATLRKPHKNCLIGIPTMDPSGPKYRSWIRHEKRFSFLLRKTRGPFYSAFISRPDSAPWIRTPEYAQQVQKLWAKKHVWVVCEKDGSALRAVGPAAGSVTYTACPRTRTYDLLDRLEAFCLRLKPDIAILSCGPAATCLANRLASHKIQTIDFGSGGSFIAKLLKGENAAQCRECKRELGKPHKDWCFLLGDDEMFVTEADT
jgi:hypothetical protein